MENGADTLFPVTLLIGVGLVGGSLGLSLLEHSGSREILGTDTDIHSLEVALRRGAITATADDWRHEARFADLIVFCTPPAQIVADLRMACELAKPGALVTDVGSTKTQVAAAAGVATHFVGGHPMAGSEQGGVRHAHADLFDGATWAVCPTPFSSEGAIEKVHILAKQVGAHPLVVDADTHDAMAAVTSHLPHALAAALMAQAGAARNQFPDLPQLSAGGLRDGTRVSGSSPTLWRDICLSNRIALRNALRDFHTHLQILEDALDADDADAVEAFFRDGQSARRSWYGS